ncbi:MAG TPA: DoxX family protein [Myxococcales bacterium]
MAADIGMLILRVFVGLQLASHGSQKLFGLFGGHGPAGTGGFFESLGFKPGRLFAVAAGAGEFGGGLLLALGWLTPLAAAAIVATMLTAIAVVHADKGFFATEGGFELPLLLAVIAVCVTFMGPGAISIDRALGWNLSGWLWGVIAAALGVLGAVASLAIRGIGHRAGERASA